MTNKHGDFIWYELMTPDAEAAQAFYGAVIGWDVQSSGQDGVDYRTISMAGTGIGGVLPLSPEMIAGGARPGWLGYIAASDVDACAERIAAAGGAIHIAPTDIPDTGRFAMLTDPQGAAFYIMRGFSDGASEAFAAEAPRDGHCAWNELATPDPEAALEFYGQEFGWAKDGEMDMGPMGTYHFVRHGALIGAMMPKPDAMPVPAWSFYFRVPDIDAAATTIAAQGGQIVMPPQEIPGGDYTIIGLDPTGATFALVGKRKD